MCRSRLGRRHYPALSPAARHYVRRVNLGRALNRMLRVVSTPRAQGLHPHQTSYVCVDVFEGRSVLWVSRPDGDWCFLCGGEHEDEPTYLRVVGIGHVIDADPTLNEVLDLKPDEEAERSSVGGDWTRNIIPPDDDG